MDRYEHCMIEFYWTHPGGADAATFKSGFSVFHADGRVDNREGGNPELTALLNQLGAEGWRVATASTAANWILWTLERRGG
ncbi:MAG: hypothetical protein KF894_33545 [Labilithrix sp.]|nr:hypothetical protein [Labilithrix sp.]